MMEHSGDLNSSRHATAVGKSSSRERLNFTQGHARRSVEFVHPFEKSPHGHGERTTGRRDDAAAPGEGGIAERALAHARCIARPAPPRMNAMLDATPPPQPINRLLWMAAAAGAEAEVRLHIARGDYLEWTDKRGVTPLMVAASRDRANICTLLLEAGVDASALDAGGRDALTIARAAGALAAADAIAWWVSQGAIAPTTDACAPPLIEPISRDVQIPSTNGSAREEARGASTAWTPSAIEEDVPLDAIFGDWEPAEPTQAPLDSPKFARRERLLQQRIGKHQAIDNRADWGTADAQEERVEDAFGDWEPVAPTTPPPDKPEFAQIEALRQRRIGEHAPIDDSAAWDDFKVELPAFSKPLPRADDADFQSGLRRLALLALREGSVPRLSIEDLLSEHGDAEMRDIVAEQQLLVMLGELGAASDERLPHRVGDDSFELFVDPIESVAESQEVDEALAFFEDLRSGRNDPLRIYLRSVAKRPLLKAEREAALAKAMEAAIERALDALACWPAGLRALLDSVSGSAASPAILGQIVATARDEAEAEADVGESNEQPDATPPGPADDLAAAFAAEPVGSLADALEAFAAIRDMAESPADAPSRADRIRERLGALRFRRPFLAKLADLAHHDRGAEADAYRGAISDLIARRDEMTRANLRLVYATARRYVYTGVPVDDLIQEGNIGLLKAVDRFDWRRGFKFSTMAMWWIKQQISRSVADTAFLIRPPVHVHEKMSKLRRLAEAFERSNGREPTAAERAAMLGVSTQKLEMLARPSSDPLSIEDAEALGAFDLDAGADPMDMLANRQIERLVSEKISTLKRRSEAVVRMRTGIGVDDALTLEQVGLAFEVTRERVRQIEAKAMRTLASFRFREELAIATGRPLPKRTSVAPAEGEEDGDEAHQSEGGKAAPKSSKAAGRSKTEQAPREVAGSGDPADPDALTPSMRGIFDAARELGLDVEVGFEDSRARVFVAEFPQTDGHRRKLVRDMLQMGFVREAGKGYRR